MNKLKISGDTGPVKKSILELSRELKNLGKTKISVFSEKERRFITTELNRELTLMKAKLAENRTEISKMVQEQTKLQRGSKAELEQRKKILEAYRTQTRLARQASELEKSQGFGGRGLMGRMMGLAGGAALSIGGAALYSGYRGAKQYAQGASNRVRLKGLGVSGDFFGSEQELANAGLTEQELIRRRIQATSVLGRGGGSQESVMQQARFERAYGLEGGTLTNTAGALRANFGGRGADQVQLKLQASVLASGIEDAIAPYLDSITDVLSDINKNGMTNTDEMIRTFATLVKQGQRTPEQIADAFRGINQAVKGSTGEANAFFQTAFARGGIGGGTIGATRLAMSSGGIFGLNEEELGRRGFNQGLISNMRGAGFTSGVGQRSKAILNQFKRSAGMRPNQRINDVTDLNTMVGLSQMANSTLGTEGIGGFDALRMMEQVQNKQMSQAQFQKKLQEIKDRQDPTVDRLNKINSTLAGQTTILRDINNNLLEGLGKTAVKAANVAVEADNTLVQGTKNVAGAVDQTGLFDAAQSASKSIRDATTGGGLGVKLYDMLHGDNDGVAKAVERGMNRAMQTQHRNKQTNRINVNIRNGDGKVSNKTHR